MKLSFFAMVNMYIANVTLCVISSHHIFHRCFDRTVMSFGMWNRFTVFFSHISYSESHQSCIFRWKLERFQAIFAYSAENSVISRENRRKLPYFQSQLTYLTHYFGINFELTVNIHAFILFGGVILYFGQCFSNMNIEQSLFSDGIRINTPHQLYWEWWEV